MLYGYAHDEQKEGGVKTSAGYIYKLNSDGTSYSTVLKLEYDPKGPLLSQGNFLYGMAEPVTRERIFDVRGENFRLDRSVIPGGFFRMAVDSATSTLIAPTKETIVPDAMIIYNRAAYAEEPFVRVVDHLPGTKDTTDTNFCDITVRRVRGRVLTISCLDNLIKGASGAAVQNFNLMYGFAETTALL
jgi:hypothetical protein